MRFLFAVRKWLLLFIAFSIGGCQRASYQFQPVASATYQAVLPTQRAASAVVTIAAQPTALLSESRHPAEQHSRHPAGRRIVRVKTLLIGKSLSAAASVAPPVSCQQQEPRPITEPVRHRSRGIAIILAALSLTYLPLSLHNFYLGYYGRGIAAIALVITGTYLVVLSFFASIFSGAGLVGLGLVGLAMLGGWFIWQIIDLVRIITGDLKPKNGEYGPRLFQTNSDAEATPHPRTD